jgi:WD40 repeat protein
MLSTRKAMAFTPSGTLLATAGLAPRLILWDVKTGEKRREWQLHDEVCALAFAPDGRHLAVGNADGTLYVLRLLVELQ